MRSLAVAVAIQLACQLFKVAFYSLREHRFRPSYFVSAGGMPSAHTAFVTALTVSVGLRSGFASELFAVAAVFGLIVVYDSFRLRGAVERQARLMKQLAALHPEVHAGELTELVGHSLPEIAAGLVAGGGLAAAAWAVLG
jgi:acid phosphatase family membrane protein YuiD